MSRTFNLWMGWLCLIINGYEIVSGLITGTMGGFATILNVHDPATFAREPGRFVLFFAISLALCAIGVWMIATASRLAERGR